MLHVPLVLRLSRRVGGWRQAHPHHCGLRGPSRPFPGDTRAPGSPEREAGRALEVVRVPCAHRAPASERLPVAGHSLSGRWRQRENPKGALVWGPGASNGGTHRAPRRAPTQQQAEKPWGSEGQTCAPSGGHAGLELGSRLLRFPDNIAAAHVAVGAPTTLHPRWEGPRQPLPPSAPPWPHLGARSSVSSWSGTSETERPRVR